MKNSSITLVDFMPNGWMVALLMLGVAVFTMVACGGGSAPTIVQSGPAPVPNLCPAAFAPASAASAADVVSPRAQVETKPVALSSCIPADAKHPDVAIGGGKCGPDVYVDKSFTGTDGLGTITIASDGILAFPEQTAELDTDGIVVSGRLSVGTPKCSIGDNDPTTTITIKFTGDRPNNPDGSFAKGIEVLKGGTLWLFGARGVSSPFGIAKPKRDGVSWTYLSAPAGPEERYGKGTGVGSPVPSNGSTTLQLADDVTKGAGAWRDGDWIAIGTTSFSPFETEFAQIAHVMPTAGGSQIVLKATQPLKYYHFGGADPGKPSAANFKDGPDTNYGVDERAEVALISRNIKLTADTPSPYDASGNLIRPQPKGLHWGGEIRILKDFDDVSIQGVQIEKFGKDQLASYPIHFHMDKSVKGKALVNANSIDHSYNKCITVHDTSDLTIENNVCARVVGHIFYEELGNETGIVFRHNVGLGAMSNSFDISAPTMAQREATIKAYWWAGDDLTNDPLNKEDYIGYDGFLIPDTDSQQNPTRGSCDAADDGPGNQGGLLIKNTPYSGAQKGACESPQIYYEPASGFWITNPGTQFFDNSIGGCQGVGRAYWYLPPGAGNIKFTPVGTFQNNRAHGCYGGLYSGNEAGVDADSPFPRVGGDPAGKALWAEFDGFTGFRIRDRAIWLRPEFYLIRNARLATNRDSASLVTAGGVDGTHPGNWALLKDSVLVGISRNNVDRFGPCPYPDQAGLGTGFQSTNKGCIDQTPRQATEPVWGDFIERSYATPSWNFYGFMIYDGPARIFDDRFVNFNRELDQYLTSEDRSFLGWYSQQKKNPKPPASSAKFVYEGDAALGWFNANQSAYPNSQVSKGLTFDNADLRHQVFTERVGVDLSFKDGDKNTVLVDRDGSLSGLQVVDPKTMNAVPHKFPISLNNLPFLASTDSVDECLADGPQNDLFENRPSALMTAADIATLEFGALYPPAPTPTPGPGPTPAPTPIGGLGPFIQQVTFTKDSIDFPTLPGFENEHESMVLDSRNFLGLWEPKVMRGYGYTISAQKGIPDFIDLGFTEAETTDLAKVPFYIRVGICYKSKNGKPSSEDDFTILRGRKSYGLANGEEKQLEDAKVWTDIPTCKNLDEANRGNLTGGCPANPSKPFTPVKTIDGLKDSNGKPLDNVYFYDQDRGLLFFNMIQNEPNAQGPSPLGNCDKSKADAGCPQLTGENYYACPAVGCILYVVKVSDKNYMPGPADCTPYPTYKQDPPADQNVLALLGTKTVVTPVPVASPTPVGLPGVFPHNRPQPTPVCDINAPKVIPPWSDGKTPEQKLASYLFATPPGVTLTFTPAATVIAQNDAGTQFVVQNLAIGKKYALHASNTTGSCDGSFTTSGTASDPGYTGGSGCGLAPTGGDSVFLGF
jgi:G8 domain